MSKNQTQTKQKEPAGGGVTKTRLEWALTLAEKGLLIFPLQPGSKKPRKDVSWTGIMTNDADESPFEITLTGTVI